MSRATSDLHKRPESQPVKRERVTWVFQEQKLHQIETQKSFSLLFQQSRYFPTSPKSNVTALPSPVITLSLTIPFFKSTLVTYEMKVIFSMLVIWSSILNNLVWER